MRTRGISRRRALALALPAAGVVARMLRGDAASSATQSAASPAATGPQLIIRNARPLDAETPLEGLRTLDTSNDLFFVRSHHALLPGEASASWTLTIDGEVAQPTTVGIGDLRAMAAEKRRATLECAGNGRGRFDVATTSGVQWGHGAVSTATWTGVPLAQLVERAGVQPSARHFWMEAADHGPLPATPRFLRSLPREAALGEALVAYEMNGQPLPLAHGGPLRLVVPNWYGMASTKWLTHVHCRSTESDNHFMIRGYRYQDGSGVDLMRVKSLITAPRDGELLPPGTVRVTGVAWTGSGTIAQVEISGDEGRSWQQARLTSPAQAGAWRQWESEVPLAAAGEQRVRARATDTAGRTQPAVAAPNAGGYGNNSIHEVRFRAR